MSRGGTYSHRQALRDVRDNDNDEACNESPESRGWSETTVDEHSDVWLLVACHADDKERDRHRKGLVTPTHRSFRPPNDTVQRLTNMKMRLTVYEISRCRVVSSVLVPDACNERTATSAVVEQ